MNWGLPALDSQRHLLKMREKKFKVPVVVVPGRIDRERVVGDVRHAAIVLLHEWPLPASRAKQKAMKACLDVLRGDKPPSVARSAFIEAAREAHILQDDRSSSISD